MKNFISKIKKVATSVGLAIISIPNKIFAVMSDHRAEQDLYGPPPFEITTPALYGPPEPENTIRNFLNIFRWVIIPIAFLIGIIVYFKKSKSSLKKKIIVTICAIAIIAIVYCIIYLIISNM